MRGRQDVLLGAVGKDAELVNSLELIFRKGEPSKQVGETPRRDCVLQIQ